MELEPRCDLGAEFEACPRCGGVWIDEGLFLSLLRATPTAQHLDELMEQNDGTPRRRCPHCDARMNLAWIDFLQLDRCAEHGVWLDPGELERALHSATPPVMWMPGEQAPPHDATPAAILEGRRRRGE